MIEELDGQSHSQPAERDRVQCLEIIPEGLDEHEAVIRGLERIWEDLSTTVRRCSSGNTFAAPPSLVIHDVSLTPISHCRLKQAVATA